MDLIRERQEKEGNHDDKRQLLSLQGAGLDCASLPISGTPAGGSPARIKDDDDGYFAMTTQKVNEN